MIERGLQSAVLDRCDGGSVVGFCFVRLNAGCGRGVCFGFALRGMGLLLGVGVLRRTIELEGAGSFAGPGRHP